MESFTEGWNRIKELAQESGANAERLHRCVYTTINVNDNVSEADNEMRTFFENYYGVPYESMAGTQSMCPGTPATCAAWLQGFIDAGAQTIVIRFGGPDQAGQLERCAKDVLPQLKRA